MTSTGYKYLASPIRLAGAFAPKVIFLAEGDSEVGFLDVALEHFSATDTCIFCLRGVDQISTTFSVFRNEPNFSRVAAIGVIVDADTKPKLRLKKILGGSRLAGFPYDENKLDTGGIISEEGKKLGVFISPGNYEKGRIEDIIRQEISARREHPCLDAYSKCIRDGTGSGVDLKGLVQTYISTKRGSLCGVGRAFRAGIFDVKHSAYDNARTFVQQVLI